MRILIVNANSHIRRSLVRYLASLSKAIAITEVLDGKTGLHALSTAAYDVIITEVEDGYMNKTFLDHLKSSKLLKRKPIIVYSTKDFDDTGFDNILYVNANIVPVVELEIIVKEFIFKSFVCPKCPIVDTCSEPCFYRALDSDWKNKLNLINNRSKQ